MAKVLQIIVLSLILSVSAFAQNKIAVVDTNAFYDEKLGIAELVNANKKLEVEFKPQIEKFNNLGKEMSDMVSFCNRMGHCSLEKLENRITEYGKQSEQFKQILHLFEKRKTEIIEPINKRIAEKLKEFAKQKSYVTVLDLTDIAVSLEGIFCPFDSLPDVTKEFIKFCNEEFEKEKTQK